MKREDVLRIHDELCGKRQEFEGWVKELTPFVLPQRCRVDHAHVGLGFYDGVPLKRLYDTTAVYAVQKLAGAFQTHVNSPSEQWFSYASGQVEVSEDVRGWYSRSSEVIFSVLGNSNFYTVMQEVTLDSVAFGCGAMFCDVQGGRMHFEYIPVGSYAHDFDSFGDVEVFSRTLSLNAREMVGRWGMGAVSDVVRDAYNDESKRHTERFEVIHVVCPRVDFNPNAGGLDKRRFKFASYYVEKRGEGLLEEGGYRMMPYGVFPFNRWNSPYGYSPTRLAYPDIIDINKISRNLSALGDQAVNPRIVSPSTFAGNVNFQPGGITVASRQDFAEGVLPREWLGGGNYQVGVAEKELRRQSIEKHYYLDALAPLDDAPASMSATQASIINNDRIMAFGVMALLYTNHLSPVMKRVFDLVMNEMGGLSELPSSLVDEFGEYALPDVVFQSRFVQMINAMKTNRNIQLMGTVRDLMEVVPGVVDNFRVDLLVKDVARNLSVSEDFIRSEDEVESMRAEAAEAQQVQMQQAQQFELMKNGKLGGESGV